MPRCKLHSDFGGVGDEDFSLYFGKSLFSSSFHSFVYFGVYTGCTSNLINVTQVILWVEEREICKRLRSGIGD